MKRHKLKSITAFSLIELSVAMLVIAVVVAGTVSVMSSRLNNEGIKITNQRIEAIYKAMGQYLILNKRLPCPASLNLARSSADYGVSRTCSFNSGLNGGYHSPNSGQGYWRHSSFHNLFYGAIPTKTLGLPVEYSEDGFGSKFSYAIISGFTTQYHFGFSNVNQAYPVYFNSDDYGGTLLDKSGGNVNANTGTNSRITIYQATKNTDGTTSANLITSDAAFVIISHGPNRNGAWSANSTTQNSDSTSAEEKSNQVLNSADNATSSTATFFPVSPATPFIASSNVDNIFDDIVFYKTRTDLVNDFNQHSLIPCESMPTFNSSGGLVITWAVWPNWPLDYTYTYAANGYNYYLDQINYESHTPPNRYDVCSGGIRNPGKRCGLYGIWDQGTAGAAIKCQ